MSVENQLILQPTADTARGCARNKYSTSSSEIRLFRLDLLKRKSHERSAEVMQNHVIGDLRPGKKGKKGKAFQS
jgi:hypothetical protein